MIPDHTLSRLIVRTLALCQAAITPYGDHGAYYLLTAILHFWLAAEMVFYVFFHVTQRRMQYATSLNTLTHEDRKVLVSHCIANIDDAQEWLCGWFYKDGPGQSSSRPEFEEIYMDNVIEWLSWAFFTSPMEDIMQNQDYLKEIHWMISEFQNKFQAPVTEGYNQQVHARRLNLDPIKAHHRPLLVYMVIQLANLFYGKAILQYGYGMKKYDLTHDGKKRISYWLRDGDRNKKPIVFIHGIGAGLMCYTPFLHRLVQLDAPIFCIELPFIAMRCVEDVFTMQEIGHDIHHMLHHHHCQNAVFVAHSLGTAVASWILQHLPTIVDSVILLDPICFMLHYDDICTNFVYRIPKTASESLVKYFVSTELYISHYISRHFHWFQCALYVTDQRNSGQRSSLKKKDMLPVSPPPSPTPTSRLTAIASETAITLPHQTKVFLSERDNIVNSPRVNAYLSNHGVNTELMSGLDHASFLIYPSWQQHIISTISDYIQSN
ncbi:Alpha/Beta hydrolase protein [Chlamydoabsidia padenii]|nr:Alpha/Beta hydrolase protein [Chlamydoabsidia padenii]